MSRMKRLIVGIALLFGGNSAYSAGCDTDFSWSSGKDMAGAYFICSFTAFTKGECPDVLFKCFTDWDLMHWDCDWKGCDLVHECLKPPDFFWDSASQQCTKNKGYARASSQNDAQLDSTTQPLADSMDSNYSSAKSEADDYLDVLEHNEEVKEDCENEAAWFGFSQAWEDNCNETRRQEYPAISPEGLAIVREQQAREGQEPDGPSSDSNWEAGPEFETVNEEYDPEENPYGYINNDDDWTGYEAPITPP